MMNIVVGFFVCLSFFASNSLAVLTASKSNYPVCGEAQAKTVMTLIKKHNAAYVNCNKEAKYTVFPFPGKYPSATQFKGICNSKNCMDLLKVLVSAKFPDCAIANMPVKNVGIVMPLACEEYKTTKKVPSEEELRAKIEGKIKPNETLAPSNPKTDAPKRPDTPKMTPTYSTAPKPNLC